MSVERVLVWASAVSVAVILWYGIPQVPSERHVAAGLLAVAALPMAIVLAGRLLPVRSGRRGI